jgi:hypothetical protein
MSLSYDIPREGIVKTVFMGYQEYTCYACGNWWRSGLIPTCTCKKPPSMPKLKSGWYKLKVPVSKTYSVPVFPSPAPFVYVES